MINPRGIIQNNKTASDFIRQQRRFNDVYRILDKTSEREMIGKYARLKPGPDGKPMFRYPTSPDDKHAFECEFDWIGDETELRLKLVMHNLQAVTKISSKHCQDTRDYDNMYAKGLYGLVRAANEFHPFKLITKVARYETTPEGKKVAVKEPKLEPDGSYGFIKFNTFAQFWIFKYVVDEFQDKSIPIDNNSISLNELVKVYDRHGSNGLTAENFLYKSLAPELEPQPGVQDVISADETSGICESIRDYIKTTDDISALEKSVLEETFYNGVTNVKKLSSLLKIPQQTVMDCQVSALGKLKEFLYEEYGIESLSDIM